MISLLVTNTVMTVVAQSLLVLCPSLMALFSVDISHTNIFISCYFVVISSTFSRASDFGLMKADRNGRITDFLEKPKGENLKSMVHSLPLTSKTNNYLMICLDKYRLTAYCLSFA